MRRIFFLLILASFVGVAVFGFSAMGHSGAGHTHGGCIAAIAQGLRGCGDEGNTAAPSVFSHLETFKWFSQALTSIAAGFSLLLISFLLGIIWHSTIVDQWVEVYCRTLNIRFYTQIITRVRTPILRWLALHESRDIQGLPWVQAIPVRA